MTVDPTLRIPVAGETVAATRFEPTTADGPRPAVLWITPYHKERERFIRYGPILEYLAGAGYEVVVANLIGTGASTGRIQRFGTPAIGRQCGSLVEWLADQAWTTDGVGVIGKSAGGYTCLATAAADPDPLRAAVPIMTPSGPGQALYTPGGLFRLSGMLGWAGLYAVMAGQPSSRRDDAGRWREQWHRRLDALREEGPERLGMPGLFTDDDPGDAISVEEITVPTLAVGGFRDRFAPETVEYVRAIDAPTRLLMGPWRHIMPHRGRESTIGFRRWVIDWFDRFLTDEPTGVLADPEVIYWTERHGGRQIGAGTWRGRQTWPTVEEATDPVKFAVAAGGLEHGAAPGNGDSSVERSYTYDQTVGVASYDFGSDFLDSAPDDARSLTFESPALDRPLEWTGTGRVTVHLVPQTDTAALCVRIVDVGMDGRARPVTRGAQRLGDGRAGSPIEPGESQAVSVGLRPTSHVFEVDHRVRLAIAAADYPRHLPVGPDGEFTVTSTPDAPTTVTFPGEYGAPVPFDDTIELPPPDDTLPVTPSGIESQHVSGETCRGHHDGITTISRAVSGESTYPYADRARSFELDFSVASDDPDSVVGESTYESVLEFDDESVTTTAETRITREGVNLTLTVTVDGTPIFEETWIDEDRARTPSIHDDG